MYMFKCILVILGYVQLSLGTTITRNYSQYNPASSVPKSESSGKSTEQTHLKNILEDIGREFYELSKDVNALRKEYSENSNSVAEKLEKINAKVTSGFENSTFVLDQLDRKVDLITEMVETKVYCDMERDGGGWTIIQRRGVRPMPKSQRESFNRTWKEYENGFGSPYDDHWIGLENMHSLTRHCENEIKITLTAWNGTEFYGGHSNFQVAGRGDDYCLTLGNWTGGTLYHNGNMMEYNNGMKFTTFDNDNDNWNGVNCAVTMKGAWWHNNCGFVSLNGKYAEDGSIGTIEEWGTGIYWYPHYKYSYMKSEMMIRSKC